MTKAAELAKMGEVLTNSQIGGRRNIILNGAMNVAQRATSVTGLGDGDEGYVVQDRWRHTVAAGAGRYTATQTADGPSGFANCFKIACTTADTSIAATERFMFVQRIEGQDLQQLKKGTSDAEKVTVSFYVKGHDSATYVCALYDVDNDRFVGATFPVTTSWARQTITFPADTTGALGNDNTNDLELRFILHAGSNFTSGTLATAWESATAANFAVGINSIFESTSATFFLTGVQLEVGSQATPFEHRSFGEELGLCQRYYEQFVIGSGSPLNMLLSAQLVSNNSIHTLYFKTKKRAFPSTAILGGAGWGGTEPSNTHTNLSFAVFQAPTGAYFYLGTGAGHGIAFISEL